MKYSAIEICKIGIEVESNGRAYYLEARRRIKDENLKRLLLKLADEESFHEQMYRKILAKLEAEAGLAEACCFDDEYARYIEALAAARTFTSAQSVETGLAAAATPAAILTHAMAFEKDAILWFTEMRRWVDAEEQPVIDQFIAFEKQHLTLLSAEVEKLRRQ